MKTDVMVQRQVVRRLDGAVSGLRERLSPLRKPRSNGATVRRKKVSRASPDVAAQRVGKPPPQPPPQPRREPRRMITVVSLWPGPSSAPLTLSSRDRVLPKQLVEDDATHYM